MRLRSKTFIRSFLSIGQYIMWTQSIIWMKFMIDGHIMSFFYFLFSWGQHLLFVCAGLRKEKKEGVRVHRLVVFDRQPDATRWTLTTHDWSIRKDWVISFTFLCVQSMSEISPLRVPRAWHRAVDSVSLDLSIRDEMKRWEGQCHAMHGSLNWTPSNIGLFHLLFLISYECVYARVVLRSNQSKTAPRVRTHIPSASAEIFL